MLVLVPPSPSWMNRPRLIPNDSLPRAPVSGRVVRIRHDKRELKSGEESANTLSRAKVQIWTLAC